VIFLIDKFLEFDFKIRKYRRKPCRSKIRFLKWLTGGSNEQLINLLTDNFYLIYERPFLGSFTDHLVFF
jgi:hypothetical protein